MLTRRFFLCSGTVTSRVYSCCVATDKYLPASSTWTGTSGFVSSKGKTVSSISLACRFYSDDQGESVHKSAKELQEEEMQQKLKEVTEYYSQYEKEYEGESDSEGEWVSPDESEQHIPPISMDRGEYGVFDPPDLVDLLRWENAADVCVIRMPKDVAYAECLVICTTTSARHANAVCETVNKVYKKRRSKKDPASAKIAGENDPNWKAMDMGNIIVHIMTAETRAKYDIEQLWSVGPDFDTITNESDPTAFAVYQRGDFAAQIAVAEEKIITDMIALRREDSSRLQKLNE